ncbi:hypothetical protein [Flavobacterium sp.]|uniref:hypothetical protein n=1 Tax=Flavobacterium sp. TaxID=239 RepID=UPI003D113346
MNGKNNHQDLKRNIGSLIIEAKKSDADSLISDYTNIVEKKVQAMAFEHILLGCRFASTITPSDRKKSKTCLSQYSIFIEPSNSNLLIPDHFEFDKKK